jgi:Zinc finger, C3HC4 type (RING finger)
VTERAFSEFPTDKCIERLRLAPGTSFCNGTGAGWISIRLNKKFPEDRLIVQYVGLDNSFDHRGPGLFHYQQACAASALATSNTPAKQQLPHQQPHPPLLDHERLRDPSSHHQFNHPQHQVSTTPTIHEISSIDENESRSSMSSSGGGGGGMTTATASATTAAIGDSHHQQHPPLSTHRTTDQRRRRRPDTPDNSCLCCIDKTRNATMVHGDTGHIACCLDCARMLKASGQPCPVCRLPIDLVILHYWA